jgi:hypothetical protein
MVAHPLLAAAMAALPQQQQQQMVGQARACMAVGGPALYSSFTGCVARRTPTCSTPIEHTRSRMRRAFAVFSRYSIDLLFWVSALCYEPSICKLPPTVESIQSLVLHALSRTICREHVKTDCITACQPPCCLLPLTVCLSQVGRASLVGQLTAAWAAATAAHLSSSSSLGAQPPLAVVVVVAGACMVVGVVVLGQVTAWVVVQLLTQMSRCASCPSRASTPTSPAGPSRHV